MWERAAELIRGGLTYEEVSGRLSESELRKKFGLEVVPLADTIRYQIKRRGLLDRRRPGSALSPDDLKAHHQGLVFLGLALREQVSLSRTRRGGWSLPLRGHLKVKTWHGFDSGLLETLVAQTGEEFEVEDEWTTGLFDPRTLRHYPYFVEHLESSASGREVARILETVFISAERYATAFQASWELITDLIDNRVRGESDGSSAKLAENVMGRLHSNEGSQGGSGKPSRRGKIARSLKVRSEVETEAFDALRSGPERLELQRSRRSAGRALEKLRWSLKPTSLVRRMVQDGECSICGLDD